MQSIWRAATMQSDYPELVTNLEVDVAIVGGGITGMLCAAALAEEGRSVALLEADRIGLGSTGNSTGNLYALVGERHCVLDRHKAATVAQARAAGIDAIEALVARHRIDCDFVRCPWILYAETKDGQKAIDRERELIDAAGLKSYDASARVPFTVKSAIGVIGQAQLNPLRFVVDLAERIVGDNCRIFEHSRVMEIEPGERCRVLTRRAMVTAGTVVLATHSPKGVLKIQTALAPYREYGIAAPFAGKPLEPGIYWSADEPFHSLRRYRFDERDYLVVVGGEHKTGAEVDTLASIDALAPYATERFALDPVAHRWSAQNYRSADGLPFIGASALGDNVLIATGFAADGLTYAAVAARIVKEILKGHASDARTLFDTNRFAPVAAAKNFVVENAKVAAQYLRKLPGVVRGDPMNALARGEGHIVEIDGEKCGAYCDAQGGLHVVSAVCTHMRCIVRWNAAETTWDCPCHGSRFTYDGAVIEGPALADLPQQATEGLAAEIRPVHAD